ncbi:hypothetical protein JIN84_17810 [Luteolibacter yonseiensis]|uniref:Uncharacterized protein n=1 Tax=Luteolibacter yonseiensis TaxID=1144680 RepID=A0A934R5C8_9BACT|nr:hypothetical protein [Luteolibacter yonseiensis]MBK1817481.1 hypothetical protein [Luteolibacter yonseiensis]
MSNPTQPLGEQPVAPTTPVETPASEQQAPSDHSTAIAELAPSDLLKILEGTPLESPAPEPTPAPTAAPVEETPAAEPASTPPASEQQPVEHDAPPSPGEGPKSSKRISFNGLPADQQQEIANARDLVRNGDAPDMLAALQILRGTAPVATSTPEATPATAPATSTTPPDVAAIEAKIAELSEQRDKANDDYDRDTARQLEAEIRVQERLLVRAEITAEQQQQAAVSYQAAYDKAVDQLEERFPAVLDETSEFYQILNDRVIAAKHRNDPMLQRPDFILEMAEKLDATLNPKPTTPGPIPPKSDTVPEQRMGMQVAPAHTAAPRLNAVETDALIKNAKPDELLAVIDEL